ncbi:MAG: helix-turn-helix transcriptional regulator [Actinobacteria bacterium]|nr:helix-turn-helix transcriptional regulator [Actinomycetota bacterium]
MPSADVGERAHREIARLAHRGLDLIAFLGEVEEQFRRVLDFEGAACFFTIDPATSLLTGHINTDLARDDARRRAVNLGVANNEYREEDFNKFSQLARGAPSAGILAKATKGRPERSSRYWQLIRPFGLEGELRAAFVVDRVCWGGVALFRTSDQPPFEDAESRFVQLVGPDLAEGMRTALVLGQVDGSRGQESPALILIDEQGRVEGISPNASAWLEELIDPGSPDSGVLPEVVYAVAEQARLAAKGTGRHGAIRHRVPTRRGGWAILHGTVLEGTGRGAVVIIEPARSPEIAPLLLEAHGLSGREREVTFLVLQGLPTSDIATRLFISAYTVQDHLKAVFEKMGVRSRKALVAKVFFDHYFPGLQEQEPVTSTEWPAPEQT